MIQERDMIVFLLSLITSDAEPQPVAPASNLRAWPREIPEEGAWSRHPCSSYMPTRTSLRYCPYLLDYLFFCDGAWRSRDPSPRVGRRWGK